MSDSSSGSRQEAYTQNQAVREYLEAKNASKRKPGRRRSPEALAARIDAIEMELPGAPTLKSISLLQERRDLQKSLAEKEPTVDMEALEAAFAQQAKAFSERKGIDYSTWIEMGVSRDLLKRAGITR